MEGLITIDNQQNPFPLGKMQVPLRKISPIS
jgi:hypothetical protein